MTDQDHAADEQARELEVVRDVLRAHCEDYGRSLTDVGCACGLTFSGAEAHRRHVADQVQAALEPIRAAERQQAARDGEQRALSAAANEVWVEIRWQAEQHHRGDQAMTRLGCIERLDVVHAILRNRADGVTRRSET